MGSLSRSPTKPTETRAVDPCQHHPTQTDLQGLKAHPTTLIVAEIVVLLRDTENYAPLLREFWYSLGLALGE